MSPIIAAHVSFALFSVLFGYYALHIKPTEKTVAILSSSLTVVALSGFLIKTTGSFSALHIFSVITLVSVLLYIMSKQPFMLRIKNIVGPYVGLIIAFAFTVLPSRRLGIMVSDFFGSTYAAYILFTLLLALATAVTYLLIKKYFITNKVTIHSRPNTQ